MRAAKDVFDLAAAIYGEARGESRKGQVAVGHVIQNRARAAGLSIDDVVYGRSQFTALSPRDTNRTKIEKAARQNTKTWQQAVSVANDVLSGRVPDPTGNATHYHTKAVSPDWGKTFAREGKRTTSIGAHTFYSDPVDARRTARAAASRPVAPIARTPAMLASIPSATPPQGLRADERLANAWGPRDPNMTRGLLTPANTPVPAMRQPTIDQAAVRRGVPAPTRAPRPTIDSVQVAQGLPKPTEAFRGITLSSAPANTFATAYAPEPRRVGAVAAMPVASQQYDMPATPTPRSTVQGRPGIPTPMQAPRGAMPATRSARVGPGLPDQRVAQAFQDATRFVDLNERYPSTTYNPNAPAPSTRVATPTPAPRLGAPVQAGLGPVAAPRSVASASLAPERLADFPTPTQRGVPRGAPQLAAERVPDLTSHTLPGAAPSVLTRNLAGFPTPSNPAPVSRPGIPSYGGVFSNLDAAKPQAPIGVAGEQRVQPVGQPLGLAGPAADQARRQREAYGPQMPALDERAVAPRQYGPNLPSLPASAPIPSSAARTRAAAQAAPAPLAASYSQPAPPVGAAGAIAAATSTPDAWAGVRSPTVSTVSPEVTPYGQSSRQKPEVESYASKNQRIGNLFNGGFTGPMAGAYLGGLVGGPVGAIAGGLLGSPAVRNALGFGKVGGLGGLGGQALGDGVRTGLITGRAIPADVLRDPNRYGRGGYTGLGLPSVPNAPRQTRSRDRTGGRGDSGPSMSKEASDAIGKAGAGRGGLY